MLKKIIFSLVDNLMAYIRNFSKDLEPEIVVESFIAVAFNEDLVIQNQIDII